MSLQLVYTDSSGQARDITNFDVIYGLTSPDVEIISRDLNALWDNFFQAKVVVDQRARVKKAPRLGSGRGDISSLCLGYNDQVRKVLDCHEGELAKILECSKEGVIIEADGKEGVGGRKRKREEISDKVQRQKNLARIRNAILDCLSPRAFARVIPYVHIKSLEGLAETGHLRPLLDFFQTDYANFNAMEILIGKADGDMSKEEMDARKIAGQVQKLVSDAELYYDVRLNCDTPYFPDELRTYNVRARNAGPQFQLPTLRMVSDTAPSIQFAMEGNIAGLKQLFNQGLASVRDVSCSRRFTLMRWALYGGMWNYKTVQFLIEIGAPVDEDSYQNAWDCAYRHKSRTEELQELQCILLNPPSTHIGSWGEEQQFFPVHKIIFGLSRKQLRDELDSNPDAVHVKDAMGRTALDWATARAQLSDMRLLIERGSPLETMDVSGRTTVLHAVDSHSDEALRILLEAGANPNPEVPSGLFRSSPLTAASFGGLAGMIKLLIKFGAKVDACNPEGRTALQVAASMDNVECADILLTHGADPGSVSSKGQSPFMTAISYNSQAVLKLFTGRPQESMPI